MRQRLGNLFAGLGFGILALYGPQIFGAIIITASLSAHFLGRYYDQALGLGQAEEKDKI